MRYQIRDREAGNPIDDFSTLQEAVEELKRFEEDDEREGEYTEGFYEIVEIDENGDTTGRELDY